jgi:hypothetical protein
LQESNCKITDDYQVKRERYTQGEHNGGNDHDMDADGSDEDTPMDAGDITEEAANLAYSRQRKARKGHEGVSLAWVVYLGIYPRLGVRR